MKTERIEAFEVTQIYHLWNECSAAINAKDLERWITLWCANGIQMPPDTNQLVGKEEIRKHVEGMGDQLETGFSINPDVVHVFGDYAYTHGSFSSLVTPEEGGKTKQINGKFLSIIKKQIDGSWKIMVNCFNFTGEEESKEFDPDW